MENGMSACIVVDSTTLFTLLERQEGWEDVVDFFLEAVESDMRVLLSAASWGEMLNMAARTYHNYARAERVIQSIEWLPIRIVDGNRETERLAARVFSSARLSYAASHAVARAMQDDAELVTGDPEFRRVETELPIRWIGGRSEESVHRACDPDN